MCLISFLSFFLFSYERQNIIMTPLSGGCDYVKSAYVGGWLNQSRQEAEKQWYQQLNSTTTNKEEKTTKKVPSSYNSVLRGTNLETIRFVRTKNIQRDRMNRKSAASSRLLMEGEGADEEKSDERWCNSVIDKETEMIDSYSLSIVWDDVLLNDIVNEIIGSHVEQNNSYWNAST
jgi:hypothetical protein